MCSKFEQPQDYCKDFREEILSYRVNSVARAMKLRDRTSAVGARLLWGEGGWEHASPRNFSILGSLKRYF